MTKLLIKKTAPTAEDVHVLDENIIIDFLNTNYKELNTLKYIGSFIDNIKIKNEIGIKAKLSFLIVERKEYNSSLPGEEYKKLPNGTRNIFDFSYKLPDNFPNVPTERKNYIILPTVETYTCDPKQTCSSCSGSGRCKGCDGSGWRSCKTCKGTKKVEERYGTNSDGSSKYRKVACGTCDGRGKNSCSDCNGTKKCSRCEGSGKVTCTRCDGTSLYQTYIAYSDVYKPVTTNFYFSENQLLNDVIPITENKTSFDDNLIEWKTQSEILLDNRELAIKTNKHSSKLITSLENISDLTPHQKLGKVHLSFETVPITIVDYTFEGKEFQLSIVGENNIICFQEVPKKHDYNANILQRLLSLFTKKRRQISFVYIASYMFNSDGHMDDSELKLLNIFLDNIKLNEKEKNALIENLKQQFTIEILTPKIKNVRKDLRALIFAWQCAMRDGEINQSEIEAFMELSKLFKVSNEELEKIKHKATGFSRLKDVEMLEEYFKA